MKKFLVAFFIICMVAPLCAGPHYGGATPGYGSRAPSVSSGSANSFEISSGGPNCFARDGEGGSHNEVVHAYSERTKKFYNFLCETDTGCHHNTYVAMLGEACINNNSGCYTDAFFRCYKAVDDSWIYKGTFSVCKEALDGVALKPLDNSHRVLIHDNSIYEVYVLGTDKVCYAYKCNDGYKLNSDGSKCLSDKERCSDGAVENRRCASATQADGAQCKYVCKNSEWYYDSVVSCNPGYVPADGGCKKEDCADKLKGLNAKAAKLLSNGSCFATECMSGAYLVRKNGVDQGYCVYSSYCRGSDETLNIIDGKYTDLECKKEENNKSLDAVTTTTTSTTTNGNQGGELNTENKTVEETETNCTPNIMMGEKTKELREGKCIVTECDSPGFELIEDGSCERQPCTIENSELAEYLLDNDHYVCKIAKGYNCHEGFTPSDDRTQCNPTTNEDDTGTPNTVAQNEENSEATTDSDSNQEEKTTDSGLNEEESQAKIDELQAESDAAHEKENSTANKLLGAAGIGATGIGAMQMMSGMAEQNADEDAENQMKAYLATFRCNYGGLSHKGGEMAIELPGSGDLLPLYTEYVNLANDLKIRKAALDMRPGIEAEAILDGATSGLYDDVHTGKTAGMYTSLARALSDPNGEDAKKWQEQKDAAAKKKKTGMITAAVGAAGSLVGNLIVNRDKKDKDKKTESDEEIAKKYKPVSDLATNVSDSTPPTTKCPSDTTGTYPNCEKNTYVSDDMIYNPISNKLEPQSKVDTEKVVAAEKQREQDKLENNKEGSVTVNLPSVNMFEINSANLTGASMRNLNDFITKLEATGAKDCFIRLEGFTDPVGDANYNFKLAKRRTEAVGQYLDRADKNNIISSWGGAVYNGDIYGYGCTCMTGINPNTIQVFEDCSREEANNPEYKECCGDKYWTYHVPTRFAPCRRVEMTVECDFPDEEKKNSIEGVVSGMEKLLNASEKSQGSVNATAVKNALSGKSGTTNFQLIDTSNLFK